MAGESLYVIKAKYWTNEETIDGELNLPKLEDKIIHISSIQESSNAQVMLNIVKKNIPEEIFQSNFIGLTHDNAEALSSQKNGLIGLLKKELSHFFYNITDPCHCLSLAVKHSLKVLPDNIINFIEDIHYYFSFPQRPPKENSKRE